MPSFDLRLAAVVLAALTTLAACGSPSGVARPCPQFGTLTNAETLTAFAPSGQDSASVMYRAVLTATGLSCEYHGVKRNIRQMASFMPPGKLEPSGGLVGDIDPAVAASLACQSDGDADAEDTSPKKLGRVSARFKFVLTVARGPALANTEVTVPYFVAVVRGKKFVLAREEYTARISLGRGQQVSKRIEVPVNIPLAKETTGASYEVIVGLSLTPEQLAYNRRHATQ